MAIPVRRIQPEARDRLVREAAALVDAVTAPLDVVQGGGDLVLEFLAAHVFLAALCEEARVDFQDIQGRIDRHIDANEPIDEILAELWAAVDARQAAEADRYRETAAKARRAAQRRGRAIANNVTERDKKIRRMADEYRRRHPRDRQHSTRALARYLAWQTRTPEPTIRGRLKILGIV